jgi:hypothetical protein
VRAVIGVSCVRIAGQLAIAWLTLRLSQAVADGRPSVNEKLSEVNNLE